MHRVMTDAKTKELIQRIDLLIDDLHYIANMTMHETDGLAIYSKHLRETAELSADWRYAIERGTA